MGYAMEQYDAPTDQWIPLISLTQEVVVGGISLNVYNGLTEPAGKDGVWFKTNDDIESSLIVAIPPQREGVWTSDGTIPYSYNGMVVVHYDGKLYVLAGGSSYKVYCRIRDLATGVWTTRTDIPNATSNAYADIVDGVLYVFGGSFTSGTNSNVRKLDITTGVWSYGAGYGKFDSYLTGGYIDGACYLCGADNAPAYRFRKYDIPTDSWTLLPNTFSATSSMFGREGGDKFYLMGGYNQLSLNRVYDPTSNVWSLDTPLANPCRSAVTANVGGKIYVIGGIDAGTKELVRVFDYSSGAWSRLADKVGLEYITGADGDGVSKIHLSRESPATQYVLSLADASYADGTAVILPGRWVGDYSTRKTKMADAIDLIIADAWIAGGSQLKSYETYVGTGTTWNKIKDAS